MSKPPQGKRGLAPKSNGSGGGEDSFWAEAEAGYAAMRADASASAEFDAENTEWDVTLNDGLEDDPWYEGEASDKARPPSVE